MFIFSILFFFFTSTECGLYKTVQQECYETVSVSLKLNAAKLKVAKCKLTFLYLDAFTHNSHNAFLM